MHVRKAPAPKSLSDGDSIMICFSTGQLHGHKPAKKCQLRNGREKTDVCRGWRMIGEVDGVERVRHRKGGFN